MKPFKIGDPLTVWVGQANDGTNNVAIAFVRPGEDPRAVGLGRCVFVTTVAARELGMHCIETAGELDRAFAAANEGAYSRRPERD